MTNANLVMQLVTFALLCIGVVASAAYIYIRIEREDDFMKYKNLLRWLVCHPKRNLRSLNNNVPIMSAEQMKRVIPVY